MVNESRAGMRMSIALLGDFERCDPKGFNFGKTVG